MNAQPEQLLRQLKVLQLQKKEIDMQITEKKMVLEKYYMDSIIMSTFSIDGVKAVRKRKPEKWEYSESTKKSRTDMVKYIEDLYKQLGELNDRYMFNHNSEFATKEYIVQYDELKKKIYDLEK